MINNFTLHLFGNTVGLNVRALDGNLKAAVINAVLSPVQNSQDQGFFVVPGLGWQVLQQRIKTQNG